MYLEYSQPLAVNILYGSKLKKVELIKIVITLFIQCQDLDIIDIEALSSGRNLIKDFCSFEQFYKFHHITVISKYLKG